MQTPQKRPSNYVKLFKGFSSIQDIPIQTPKTAQSLSQSKITQKSTISSPFKTSQRPMVRSIYTNPPTSRDENEQVVAEFKKQLHKASLTERVNTCPGRSASKSNYERQEMKNRLEMKIKEAQKKLDEIKSTLKKYQAEKWEIVEKSDMRRSSLNGWKHGARQP